MLATEHTSRDPSAKLILVDQETEKLYEKLAAQQIEIANLRQGYVIVNRRYAVALKSLELLSSNARDAVKRAELAAQKAAVTAKAAADMASGVVVKAVTEATAVVALAAEKAAAAMRVATNEAAAEASAAASLAAAAAAAELAAMLEAQRSDAEAQWQMDHESGRHGTIPALAEEDPGQGKAGSE